MSNFKRKIDENKPYIIAEISQNHDGSLGQAHAYIDAVADMGADAVKFQTHIAAEESTKWEKFRVNFSYEDKTRYDYWKRMEFTETQWKGLYEHAIARNLDFLSSPFSNQALSMLDTIGVPIWKFGSGEVFNNQLLDAAIMTKKPIIISTGLCTWDDIDKIVEKITKNGNLLVLMQCVTAYPSTKDMININLIDELKKRYGSIVGISDHSATIYPSLAAIALGAQVVEVHVTMSHYMFGPDVKASVDLTELKQIVEGAEYISFMKKNRETLSERDDYRENMKKLFSKSLYYQGEFNAGHVIKEQDVVLKKPNNGLDETYLPRLVGKVLNRDVQSDDIVSMEDFI